MRDRIFSIVDGEPIVTAPMVNLKHFKELWEMDTSEDKGSYKRWMRFIYDSCDYRSDYFELKDKEEAILLDLFGRSNYSIPPKVQRCQEEYRRRNTPAEQRSLESAINSADGINDTVAKMKQDVKQFDDTMKELDKLINSQTDVLARMELLKEKMVLQDKLMGLVKNMADIIPKIEKNVSSIVNLRTTVEASVAKIQDSKEKVENYMIDDFINAAERGEFIRTDNEA